MMEEEEEEEGKIAKIRKIEIILMKEEEDKTVEAKKGDNRLLGMQSKWGKKK